jgi:predicted GIY-YIG superfamily endonuclease
MKDFHYVYIITSKSSLNRFYVGQTDNIEERIKKHNSGNVPHTSKYIPWEYETVIAFKSKSKAIAFEKYLKTHSGRAFSEKHF